MSFEGHKRSINDIIIHQNTLISSSDDHTIKIWNLETGECIKTLIGHSLWVRNMLIFQNKLISCASDKTIKICDLNSFECIKTLKGHKEGIRNILMYENHLISCSNDTTIKIWDITTAVSIKTLKGHQNCVITMLIYKNQLISSSEDKTIKIWDLSNMNGNCLRTLEGHKCAGVNIIIYKDQLISCAWDKNIKIWDIDSGHCLKTIKDGNYWNNKTFIYNNHLICFTMHDTILKIKSLDTFIDLKTECIETTTFVLHRGLIYYNESRKIKSFKYLPYFNDYQRALQIVFKFINNPRIAFRGKFYRGKFYVRGKRLVGEMYDIYQQYKVENNL